MSIIGKLLTSAVALIVLVVVPCMIFIVLEDRR